MNNTVVGSRFGFAVMDPSAIAKERFLDVGNIDPNDGTYTISNEKPALLICDYNWWADYETEIFQWCTKTSIHIKMAGMFVAFKDDKDKMMFMLKWQA